MSESKRLIVVDWDELVNGFREFSMVLQTALQPVVDLGRVLAKLKAEGVLEEEVE